MKLEIAEMIEEKAGFIRGLEELLRQDKRSGVDSLAYKVELHDDKTGDCYDEFIDIIYITGDYRRLLVTGNSNGANLMQIAKEVY